MQERSWPRIVYTGWVESLDNNKLLTKIMTPQLHVNNLHNPKSNHSLRIFLMDWTGSLK